MNDGWWKFALDLADVASGAGTVVLATFTVLVRSMTRTNAATLAGLKQQQELNAVEGEQGARAKIWADRVARPAYYPRLGEDPADSLSRTADERAADEASTSNTAPARGGPRGDWV
jgi:hypothetical protein